MGPRALSFDVKCKFALNKFVTGRYLEAKYFLGFK